MKLDYKEDSTPVSIGIQTCQFMRWFRSIKMPISLKDAWNQLAWELGLSSYSIMLMNLGLQWQWCARNGVRVWMIEWNPSTRQSPCMRSSPLKGILPLRLDLEFKFLQMLQPVSRVALQERLNCWECLNEGECMHELAQDPKSSDLRDPPAWT